MPLTFRFRWANALAVCLGLLAASSAWGQLRVVTWNITNYDGSTGRDAAIQTAVYGVFEDRSMSPDIILGQEFQSSTAATHFLTLLNTAAGSPGDWNMVYVNGPGEGHVVFYRTSKATYRGYAIVSYGGSYPDGPRNVVRFKMRLAGYVSHGATVFCYDSHMKAGSTTDDQVRRLTEAQNIRDNAETLDSDYLFLLGADLNMQSSGEDAYVELVGSQANNEGRFFDPISTPGAWHDSFGLRFIHTQDPATSAGMDDRFDQILVSDNLIDGVGFDYIGNPGLSYATHTWDDPNHSLRAWGNDGFSFNQPLRTTGNTMVGPTIAQALIDTATPSGGHLPVYVDLRVPAHIGSDTVIDFGQVTQGAPAEEVLNVWNAGDVALWTAAGIADLNYELSASAGFSAPAGAHADPAGDPGNEHVITMDTSTVGPMNGILTITSDAPDEPSRQVTLVGEVTAPGWCLGDMNCSTGSPEFTDIAYFVAALNGEANWVQYYRDNNGGADPECYWLMGDYSDPLDGVDFLDIVPFANSIGQPCISYVP